MFTLEQDRHFDLSGEVSELLFNDKSEPKYVRLLTPEGEHLIKIAKEWRSWAAKNLTSGSDIRLAGTRKLDRNTGMSRLKASHIYPQAPIPRKTPEPTRSKKEQILVCQKSDCLRRGAGGVCRALEQALAEQGLSEQVSVKATGCLKHCKQGPNLVMPDRSRHHHVSPEQARRLVGDHCQIPVVQ